MIWRALMVDFESESLIYGDYATVSPDFLEIDSTGPVPIFPKLTYTFSDAYWIQRGENTWQHPDGFVQYKALAANVTLHPSYRKDGYSAGDSYIFNMSQYEKDKKDKYKTGNATTWITACISQHVTFISSLL